MISLWQAAGLAAEAAAAVAAAAAAQKNQNPDKVTAKADSAGIAAVVAAAPTSASESETAVAAAAAQKNQNPDKVTAKAYCCLRCRLTRTHIHNHSLLLPNHSYLFLQEFSLQSILCEAAWQCFTKFKKFKSMSTPPEFDVCHNGLKKGNSGSACLPPGCSR